MCVWAMFTTLMKNKHWPNLHWPLCLENKPRQPRSWSNLPSLPTKYSHLVVFVTEQNKCWHMVTMKADTRSLWNTFSFPFDFVFIHCTWTSLTDTISNIWPIQYKQKQLSWFYPLNSKIEKKHGNFCWCLWTTINTTFCLCKM